MELYTDGKSRSLVVKIVGELDDHVAYSVKGSVDEALERTGAVNLIFDFSRLGFMDSSGIGMIMGRYRTVNALGGKIAVMGASENILKIIAMSGLGDIVLTAETFDDAREELMRDE
ncbi:MAG: anti-sigma factor antagonist [Oscillospiraceae bacterium]|nr:anti-sigma factor antagonist [Oscillospiraceae bacterium]